MVTRNKLCELCFQQGQPQVQRPRGRYDLGMFEEQQRGQVLLERNGGRRCGQRGARPRPWEASAALARICEFILRAVVALRAGGREWPDETGIFQSFLGSWAEGRNG